MCCEATGTLDLPAEVIETLAHYRRLLDERGWDWGDDRIDLFRVVRFSMLGPVVEEFEARGDWAGAIRSVIGDEVPAGMVVLRVDAGGGLRAHVGQARPAIAGGRVRIDVVVDSAVDADLELTVAGRRVRVPPLGAAVETIGLDGADPALPVVLGGQTVLVEGAIRTCPAAELRLSSPRCARWSVTDARGMEFDRVELEVLPAARQTLVVECDPPRLFDPAADGWYGGDLHIHMNYSGDLVCTPGDAARMQLGEGLH